MAQRQSVLAPIARLARPCEVEHFADACLQPVCWQTTTITGSRWYWYWQAGAMPQS